MSILSGLDKQCTGPALAQSNQPSPDQPAPAQSAPGPAQSAPAQTPKPCAQIRASCTQAGFVPNGANMGVGIIVDCIRPIMAGAPQRKRATKPLPQIDPQVVVACKNQNQTLGWAARRKLNQAGSRTPRAQRLTSRKPIVSDDVAWAPAFYLV